jgi:hypothetical protein
MPETDPELWKIYHSHVITSKPLSMNSSLFWASSNTTNSPSIQASASTIYYLFNQRLSSA